MNNGKGLIDFDDQLLNAYRILKNDADLLKEYQNRYKYISVDEAQDTSKVQHEIIKLLVGDNNNIFMVGDENQSIYGFRGAYPQSLFEFRNTYVNPFERYLETNYRSKQEITDAANMFMRTALNKKNKKMVAYRGKGGCVEYINVPTRNDQFTKMFEICKENPDEDIAILNRNNETATPLIDMLERQGIPYRLNKPKETLFSSKTVNNIRNLLEFSLNPENAELFLKSYHKCGLYLRKKHAENAVYWAKRNHTSILDEFPKQAKFIKEYGNIDEKEYAKERAEEFGIFVRSLSSMKPLDAIKSILNLCSRDKNEKFSSRIAELLFPIAEKEDSIPSFLKRMDVLKSIVTKEKVQDSGKGPILSTIHSCKGMEFDHVFILDAINDILPSSKSEELLDKDLFFRYDEEMKLFYVAITRAKNKLSIFCVEDEDTQFIDLMQGKTTETRCVYRKKRKKEEATAPSMAESPSKIITVEPKLIPSTSVIPEPTLKSFSRTKEDVPPVKETMSKEYVQNIMTDVRKMTPTIMMSLKTLIKFQSIREAKEFIFTGKEENAGYFLAKLDGNTFDIYKIQEDTRVCDFLTSSDRPSSDDVLFDKTAVLLSGDKYSFSFNKEIAAVEEEFPYRAKMISGKSEVLDSFDNLVINIKNREVQIFSLFDDFTYVCDCHGTAGHLNYTVTVKKGQETIKTLLLKELKNHKDKIWFRKIVS